MHNILRSWLLLTVVTVMSCVTINIYFPAEQVRGAADRIVDEVWGERASGAGSDQSEPPATQPPAKPQSYFRLLGPATAGAAQDIDVSTPEIRAVRETIKERFTQLAPYLDAGQVGLGLDGLLKIRTTDGLSLKQRAEVQRLVDAENQDRRRLYLEIAQANGFPDKVDEIQQIFAVSWSDKAAKGWYLEKAGGGWQQK